jgi:hypothetical protein
MYMLHGLIEFHPPVLWPEVLDSFVGQILMHHLT